MTLLSRRELPAGDAPFPLRDGESSGDVSNNFLIPLPLMEFAFRGEIGLLVPNGG